MVGSILAPVVIYGTLFGFTYVLLALGFTLLLGISRVLNLAYGALYMVTAYMIFYFAVELGINLVVAIVLAMAIAVAVGVAIFLLCVKFAPDPMRFLVVTLLVALFLQYLFAYPPLFQGETGLIIPGLIPTHEILLYGVSVSPVYLWTAGVTIVVFLGLWGWIEWTSYGRTVRAAAEDPETASLFGIRVRTVYIVVVAVSSAIVALAAVLIVPAQEVTPTMWVEPFVIAFVVSVIGGLEKFKWTLPAAFLLSFSQFYVQFSYPTSSSLSDIVAFIVAIAFIIVLPRGIGGIRRGR
ncbi:MAG: branched-chain amino acid ABC transporter permease [Thermoplasmata archaeon]